MGRSASEKKNPLETKQRARKVLVNLKNEEEEETKRRLEEEKDGWIRGKGFGKRE